MRRSGKHLIILDRVPPMRVEARIYAGPGVPVEEEAAVQLANAATLPGIHTAVATPDIHVGYGVPIGSIIGMSGAIIPAAVGYDINCGMRLLATGLDADALPLEMLVREIRSVIPLGEGKKNITFSGSQFRRLLGRGMEGFIGIARERSFASEHPVLADGLDLDIEEAALERLEDRGSMDGDPDALPGRAVERGFSQLGTLGGGNHFIEIQRVTDVYDADLAGAWGVRAGEAVIMIHSGSRGLGHEAGGHF
ncbi:MAG: RtcB family protein, partial [Myxococcota bacterium]